MIAREVFEFKHGMHEGSRDLQHNLWARNLTLVGASFVRPPGRMIVYAILSECAW